MTTEKLRDDLGYYEPVTCPLPDCGNPLHLIYTADQALYASFTDDELKAIRPHDVESWEIRCEAGHIVLLPPDDGYDSHLFGTCVCDPGHGHVTGCAVSDFARLKGVIELAKGCNGCNGTGKVRSGTGKTVDCPYCQGTGRKR